MRLYALLALSLSGCVSSLTGSSYSDGRFWYSNVKSASDIAGGPRQDVLVVVDYATGQVVDRTIASGPGTLQALVGIAGSVITAGGQVAGSALIRPPKNNTSANVGAVSADVTNPR